ncbi:hypothetical protein LJR219_000208 [Phenylobacterium sp. LjRoot219]|uniref:hypothetical protein n=1 Tax=Phenylobacterium sp. LjRoot219 TaxID=3342283 RepID=UPI003ED10421
MGGGLEEFTSGLKSLSDQAMLDRFYYARPAAMLVGDQEAALRRAITDQFRVSMRDVLVTGSAKLGFTTVSKPEKKRPIFSPFGDTSDIDVAIISSDLFLRFWRRTSEFENAEGWKDRSSFRRYLARGWIRPDMLPTHPDFSEKIEWFEFFQELTASGRYGPYTITAGVYYDAEFWEKYACKSLGICRQYIESGL